MIAINLVLLSMLVLLSSGSIGAMSSRMITVSDWGTVEGRPVERYTLKGNAGQEVDVITYGATITAVRTPDRDGNLADVVLGFDNIEGYLSKSNPYFGATVGRVANRIGKGRFVLDGRSHQVSRNIGENTLHGGFKGWNSKVWNATVNGDRVVMTLLSEDGDEGFPGSVIATATFRLTPDGELVIEMKGFATKPTPINLTNHSYFNLAGHASNATELYKHRVRIIADAWTVTDAESIPTGEIRPVGNSIMDLRDETVLGDVIDQVPGGGYDYNFCVGGGAAGGVSTIAKVVHPGSGRYLEVRSNQPGVQFYTSNSLPDPGSPGIPGKDGARYFRHGALCLETQNYPDAVNHPNFPDSILRPDDVYQHMVVYKFGVLACAQ